MSAPAGADSDDTSPVADVDPDAGVPIPVDFGCVDGVVEQDDGTVRIDGSILEGGGQILRNSTALASLLGRNLKVVNIRAGREKPGLRPQHLNGITAVAQMYNGLLLGAVVNSCEIEYRPRKFMPGVLTVDIKTAGSVALVVQAALPAMLFSSESSELTVIGGTNVGMSPQVDYLLKVFQPIVSKMGVNFDLAVTRRGFFPKGGGEIRLHVPACPDGYTLSPIRLLKRGGIVAVHVWTFFGGKMPRHVADRITAAARATLQTGLTDRGLSLLSVTSEIEDVGPAKDSGAGCIITATTSKGYVIAGSALLEFKQAPQDAGVAAATDLLRNIDHGGCVDEYLQDQLIIFMALAAGKSTVLSGPLSLHTKTSIYIGTGGAASRMTGAQFTCTDTGRGTVVITCKGVGFRVKHGSK